MNRSEIIELARPLMDKYNLGEWKIGFISHPKKAGECDYRTKTLRFSIPVAAARSAEDTRMTVLHEIAHALVGAGHKHDAMWAYTCRSIGGTGEAYWDSTPEVRQKVAHYIGDVCPKCSTVRPASGICDFCD